MNSDQKANIDSVVSGLSKSLVSAWGYYYLLRGFQEGSRDNPEVLKRFGCLFDQTWRAINEAFFAKVGTLLDKTKNTHSIPNLVTLVQKYDGTNLKFLLPEIEECLSKKDSPLAKIKSWRHEAVAHFPASGRGDKFYIENKMYLDDLETALQQLEDLLNYLSSNILGIYIDAHSGYSRLENEGRLMFKSLVLGMANDSKDNGEILANEEGS